MAGRAARGRRWVVVGAALGACSATPAYAEPLEPLQVGVGVIGVVGANFIDAPDDQTITIAGQTGTPASVPEYPGFAGPTAGGGPAIDLRIFEYAGLELDLLRTRDAGRADLRIVRLGVTRVLTVEIAQDAWHLPVLFKGVIPTGVARPLVFLGPEVVLPLGATADVVDGVNLLDAELAAAAKAYTMFTWGLGGEVLLPIEPVDVRLAATVRGSATPAVGDARMDRALYFGPDVHQLELVAYRTSWRYQVAATVMAAVYF